MDDLERDSDAISNVIKWVLGDPSEGEPDFNEAIKKLGVVVNGVGSAIAHSVSLSQNVSEEELKEESNWATSPKDLILFLLERDRLLDREYLANSFAGYQVYRELEDLFKLPDAEKPDEA